MTRRFSVLLASSISPESGIDRLSEKVQDLENFLGAMGSSQELKKMLEYLTDRKANGLPLVPPQNALEEHLEE